MPWELICFSVPKLFVHPGLAYAAQTALEFTTSGLVFTEPLVKAAYHCLRTRVYFCYLLARPGPARELLFCKHVKKTGRPAWVLRGAIPGSFQLLTLGGRCSHTSKGKGLSRFNISSCLVAIPTTQELSVHLLAVFIYLFKEKLVSNCQLDQSFSVGGMIIQYILESSIIILSPSSQCLVSPFQRVTCIRELVASSSSLRRNT